MTWLGYVCIVCSVEKTYIITYAKVNPYRRSEVVTWTEGAQGPHTRTHEEDEDCLCDSSTAA